MTAGRVSPSDLLATAEAARERYIDRRALADLMGVSVSTITRFVREGMPSETWGLKRTRRYLPSQALAWAQTRSTLGVGSGGNGTAPGKRQKE